MRPHSPRLVFPMLLFAQLAAIAAPLPVCYTWGTLQWQNAFIPASHDSSDFMNNQRRLYDQFNEVTNRYAPQCCQSCYNGLLMPTWYNTELDLSTELVSVERSSKLSPTITSGKVVTSSDWQEWSVVYDAQENSYNYLDYDSNFNDDYNFVDQLEVTSDYESNEKNEDEPYRHVPTQKGALSPDSDRSNLLGSSGDGGSGATQTAKPRDYFFDGETITWTDDDGSSSGVPVDGGYASVSPPNEWSDPVFGKRQTEPSRVSLSLTEREKQEFSSLSVRAQFRCNICVSRAYCKQFGRVVNEWHHTCDFPVIPP